MVRGNESIHSSLTAFAGWICAVKEIELRPSQKLQLNESALMRKLPYHPNFVQYFMHRVTDDKLQIFLRQYSGTLGDLINQRQQSGQLFTPNEIITILLDISAGLKFLHKQKVIHRGTITRFRVLWTNLLLSSLLVCSDLKSDNIFYLQLESSRLFAIGDLDTAKAVSSSDKARTVIGTPSFIAPEVLESNNETPYTPKVDSKSPFRQKLFLNQNSLLVWNDHL